MIYAQTFSDTTSHLHLIAQTEPILIDGNELLYDWKNSIKTLYRVALHSTHSRIPAYQI